MTDLPLTDARSCERASEGGSICSRISLAISGPGSSSDATTPCSWLTSALEAALANTWDLSRAAVAFAAHTIAAPASARLARRPGTYTRQCTGLLSSPSAEPSRCVRRESRSGGVAAFLREPIAVRHLVNVLSDVFTLQNSSRARPLTPLARVMGGAASSTRYMMLPYAEPSEGATRSDTSITERCERPRACFSRKTSRWPSIVLRMALRSDALLTGFHRPPSTCRPENCVSLIERLLSGRSRSKMSSIRISVPAHCNTYPAGMSERIFLTATVTRLSLPISASSRPEPSSP